MVNSLCSVSAIAERIHLQARDEVLTRMGDDLAYAESQLFYTTNRLEGCEDELADCQEMLEEQQGLSLQQSHQLTNLEGKLKVRLIPDSCTDLLGESCGEVKNWCEKGSRFPTLLLKPAQSLKWAVCPT